MGYFSKTAFLAMWAAVAACGCVVPDDYLITRTAWNTPCYEDEIELPGPADSDHRPAPIGTFTWIAMCRGVTYRCRQTKIGSRYLHSCMPTARSLQRQLERAGRLEKGWEL